MVTVIFLPHYHQLTSYPNKNREIYELNDIIDQMDVTDISRIFHVNTADYVLDANQVSKY